MARTPPSMIVSLCPRWLQPRPIAFRSFKSNSPDVSRLCSVCYCVWVAQQNFYQNCCHLKPVIIQSNHKGKLMFFSRVTLVTFLVSVAFSRLSCWAIMRSILLLFRSASCGGSNYSLRVFCVQSLFLDHFYFFSDLTSWFLRHKNCLYAEVHNNYCKRVGFLCEFFAWQFGAFL